MGPLANILDFSVCLLLVIPLMMQPDSVEAADACKLDISTGRCQCKTSLDCPTHGQCFDGKCFCFSNNEFMNETHFLCSPCTVDWDTSCKAFAVCKLTQHCECIYGHILRDNGKTSEVECEQCAKPQDCPTFAECQSGLCKCKYGVIATDSKTGKVIQCENDHVEPILVIGIAVPLAALLIGIGGVVAFYFYWRWNLRPRKTTEGKAFVVEDKLFTYHEPGDNPAADVDTPPQNVEYGMHYSIKDEKVELHEVPAHHQSNTKLSQDTPKEHHQSKGDLNKTDASEGALPGIHQPKPEVKHSPPKASPVTPYSNLNLPVAPMDLFINGVDELQLPATHSSKEDLKGSPVNYHSSKEDLKGSPVHYHRSKDNVMDDDSLYRRQNGDFHSVPSHESDSEDEEGEPAVIPTQHQLDPNNLTEAPLLSPSVIV